MLSKEVSSSIMTGPGIEPWSTGLLTNTLHTTGVLSQVESYQKMVLDAVLLNTQHYNFGILGKVEQSREMCSALPYTSVL